MTAIIISIRTRTASNNNWQNTTEDKACSSLDIVECYVNEQADKLSKEGSMQEQFYHKVSHIEDKLWLTLRVTRPGRVSSVLPPYQTSNNSTDQSKQLSSDSEPATINSSPTSTTSRWSPITVTSHVMIWLWNWITDTRIIQQDCVLHTRVRASLFGWTVQTFKEKLWGLAGSLRILSECIIRMGLMNI